MFVVLIFFFKKVFLLADSEGSGTLRCGHPTVLQKNREAVFLLADSPQPRTGALHGRRPCGARPEGPILYF